jgi:hypothetical protein
MEEDQEQRPSADLPYEKWAEDALRGVVARAIERVIERGGLPGQHHFYLTFRTDHPDVAVPPRLREKYPQEMTIVLQHQFWDLAYDDDTRTVSVGLSFGGVASKLRIPLDAMIAFADPAVRFGLRFAPVMPDTADAAAIVSLPPPKLVPGIAPRREPEAPAPAEPAAEDKPAPEATAEPEAEPAPQVVSLDAFRRRPPPRT